MSDHTITTEEQLRAIIGSPHPMTQLKVVSELNEITSDFIKRSPFIVLATADRKGNQDASPSAIIPGSSRSRTPGRCSSRRAGGNKLAFGYLNILSNPHVGIIFMIPGTNETLRVNGTAELTSDPAVCERLTARGTAPKLAIRIYIELCFFHCAKAFLRS